APNTTVAICVRSPSSARKNAITVATNTPRPRRGGASTGSAFSGNSAHAATARNDNPINQRCRSGVIHRANQAPASAAIAWLSSDARRMPAQIGHGLRNFAANTSESSWVLSPISASATAPSETRKACKGISEGPGDARQSSCAFRPGHVHADCRSRRSLGSRCATACQPSVLTQALQRHAEGGYSPTECAQGNGVSCAVQQKSFARGSERKDAGQEQNHLP